MTSSATGRRGLTALTVIAAAAFFFLGLAQSQAGAADKTSGNATFNIKSGKAGKVAAIKPAKVSKRFGKGAKVSSAAKSASFASKASSTLAGGIRFSNGKRKVKVTGLSVTITGSKTVVRGNLGGKTINVFNAKGKSNVDLAGKSAKVSGAKLSLTGSAANKIRKSLKLKKAPKGNLGTFAVNFKVTADTPVDPCVTDPNAPGCQPVITDPYLTQCGVTATSKVNGTLTPAPAAPEFTAQSGVTGPASISWGFKSSYRSYVVNVASGSLHGVDGASLQGTPPAYSGFDFPTSAFRYTDNGTPEDMTDDKAVIEGTGTALFCATGHEFRVALSNPTVVIDGENSRIDADVDANLSGTWIPTQRITVADLNVGAVTRKNAGVGSTIKWNEVSASLTAEGTKAFCGIGELDKCSGIYPPGTALDPITVELTSDTPVTVTDPYLTECGIAANGWTDGRWPAAADLPDMAGSLATTAPTSINWGFRTAFRGYVYGTMASIGQGAKALQVLDGASRVPGGDPTRGFSFPVSTGQYLAGGLNTSDDRAVINGTGTALFCNSDHGFWGKITNPTIVIDGENSRIVADISSNESGVWTPTKRVDLADLNLSGVTPVYNKSGSEVTWSNVPATLSAEAGPFVNLAAGIELDPVTVALKTPYDIGAGDTAAWNALATYVSTDLPFPNTDPTTGGCTLPVPAGGTQGAARTIDEYLALGAGTTYQWYSNPAAPAAQPDMTEGSDVSAGGLDWGIRSGLRSTVNAGGSINLTDGVTASTDYFGNGGSLAAPPGTYGTGMGAAAAFFSWPSATTAGKFNAGGAGTADDKLVLKTAGVVGLCNSAVTPGVMLYGTVVSNPTVIIDGANSRIVADVATRYRLSWVRATVDLASLDLTGVTPSVTENGNGTTTSSWAIPSGGNVKLTAAGEGVFRMMSSTTYVSGAALDGATVSATYPTAS